MFDEPRYPREAILAAMTAANLVKPLAIVCRGRDGQLYYDLVAGERGERRTQRVPVGADEGVFQQAIDILSDQ